MAGENAQSRIYLGIHWHFDAAEGIRCGDKIGDYVFTNALTPADGPTPVAIPCMDPNTQINLAVFLENAAARKGLGGASGGALFQGRFEAWQNRLLNPEASPSTSALETGLFDSLPADLNRQLSWPMTPISALTSSRLLQTESEATLALLIAGLGHHADSQP
jgi:hypothetical protein